MKIKEVFNEWCNFVIDYFKTKYSQGYYLNVDGFINGVLRCMANIIVMTIFLMFYDILYIYRKGYETITRCFWIDTYRCISNASDSSGINVYDNAFIYSLFER